MLTTSNLRNSVRVLADRANLDLASVLRQVSTPEQAKAAFSDVLPALVDRYGSAASTLAAQWYDEIRVQRGLGGSFRAVTPELLSASANTASSDVLAGVAVGPLYAKTPDWSATRTLLTGGVQRRIANYARATVTQSSVADPKARGWQRVGDGDTCDFCSQLLGRGAVYTEATADFQAHDHCACTAAPVWR